MSEPHLHKSPPEVVARLNRAHGHLRSVIEKIESSQDHVDRCVEDAGAAGGRDQRRSLDEFKTITKDL